MNQNGAAYRQLDAQKIVETVAALEMRIQKRFPDGGLGKLVSELHLVANETLSRTEWIQRPHLPLRAAVAILVLAIVSLLVRMVLNFHQLDIKDFPNFIQVLEAGISALVFIGAAILFLVSCETRIKRMRALGAIHELRAMAHIVDMHQLTKDPESVCRSGREPNPSAKRALTPFELNRYLDYCSETLACISKIAALYVQGFQDPVLLNAVDDVEDLTAGFSRKIWQKISILDNLTRSISINSK